MNKKTKELQTFFDQLKNNPKKFIESLKLMEEHESVMATVMRNQAVFGQGVFYLDPDEILYGKTKLNKVKKTKLGKLIV